MIKYIQNEQHYKEVLSKASKVKESLWIGTADIKDLYVGDVPFLKSSPTCSSAVWRFASYTPRSRAPSSARSLTVSPSYSEIWSVPYARGFTSR